jgi:ABC-type uncharacterized transport system permease subunit
VHERKWKEIAIYFIMGLPRTQSGYDSIWIIIDQLIMVAQFIPVKTTYSRPQLVELYMSRMVCLYGVSKKIVSDRGIEFTSQFWERLHQTSLSFTHLRPLDLRFYSNVQYVQEKFSTMT